MSKDNGGAAFPSITPDMPVEGCPGMTLRDYLAAKAMQGYISAMNVDVVDALDEIDEDYFEIARGAYAQADAMLEARKK